MCEATANVLAAQTEIGIRLRDGSHPAIKVLESRAGWKDGRFARYFPANRDEKPTQLPAGALHTLIRREVLPAELLSLLVPDGVALVAIPKRIDLDELERRCLAFLTRKHEAHTLESPAGRDLSDCETAELIVLGEHVKAAGA